MKAAFLIDANLPDRVPLRQNENSLFVVKIDPTWSDNDIWQYAKENNLVIVTKDKDFLVKQTIDGAPPNVVQVKFGNLKLSDFIRRIEAVWPEVINLLSSHSTINIFETKIEAIK